jgi:hypothetical protein
VHDAVEGHDTPLNPLLKAPSGDEVDSIVHRFPFQRSASVTSTFE